MFMDKFDNIGEFYVDYLFKSSQFISIKKDNF